MFSTIHAQILKIQFHISQQKYPIEYEPPCGLCYLIKAKTFRFGEDNVDIAYIHPSCSQLLAASVQVSGEARVLCSSMSVSDGVMSCEYTPSLTAVTSRKPNKIGCE